MRNGSHSTRQHVIWPWETRRWPEIKEKIIAPINSFIDLDSRITALSPGKIRPRIFGELFTRYYAENEYAAFRPHQKVLIDQIIPMMQKLMEGAPKLFRGFDSRVLVSGIKSNVVLTKPQIATILAFMFFNLLNYDYISNGGGGPGGRDPSPIENFPDPSFTDGFVAQHMIVLQCILAYFVRVYERMHSPDEDVRNLFNAQIVIVQRSCLSQVPKWSECEEPVVDILIGEGSQPGSIGTIDDSPAAMHVVFSHEYLGGELFKNALTQEELTLLIRPEALVALIFCEKLSPVETVTVLGTEKYSQYQGLGSGIKFTGPFQDNTPVGYNTQQTEAMLQHALIFMDASTKTSGVSQCITEFDRDLNKAFCGFSSLKFSRKMGQIATSGWSCGFLGSNLQVKFIQQLLAASVAGKELIYYAGNKNFEEEIIIFNGWLQKNKFTVAQLYTAYTDLMKSNYTGPNTRLNDLNVFVSLQEM